MGFTHRLFLKDGHTFMTDADRDLMEQREESARQSAAIATNAAEKAREHASNLDMISINANIALKGDSLHYDPDTQMLHLSSDGGNIGSGVLIPLTGDSSVVLTLKNTTGWAYKTVQKGEPCIVSFDWSSIKDSDSTGDGFVTVKVGNTVRYSTPAEQGEHSIDISDCLSLGHNLVHVIVSDVYNNRKIIPFIVTMYDFYSFKSTQLITRTIDGEYVNDRVTSVGTYAFAGTNLDVVKLNKVTSMGYYVFAYSNKNMVVYLPELTTVSVHSFGVNTRLRMIVLPKVKTCSSGAFGYATIQYIDTGMLQNIGRQFNATINHFIIRNVNEVVTSDGFVPAKYLYVPAALIDTYAASTTWCSIADKIRALEEYTLDGTVNGDLDFDKIESEV